MPFALRLQSIATDCGHYLAWTLLKLCCQVSRNIATSGLLMEVVNVLDSVMCVRLACSRVCIVVCDTVTCQHITRGTASGMYPGPQIAVTT